MKLLLEAVYITNSQMGAVALPLLLTGFAGWIYILYLVWFLYRSAKAKSLSFKEFDEILERKIFPRTLKRTFLNKYAHFLYYYGEKKKVSKKRLIEMNENILLSLRHSVVSRLQTIKMLASISPLLGLLGTVNGIIQTFRIITQEGTTNPIMLSGGISQALITTEVGLFIAVPFIFMYTILNNYYRTILARMEELESLVI